MSTLYFIKGDSSENWGAMKLSLKKDANVSRLIWQTAQDGWTCVGAREFNAWRKKHSGVNSSRPTPRAVDGGQAGDSSGQLALPTATNA